MSAMLPDWVKQTLQSALGAILTIGPLILVLTFNYGRLHEQVTAHVENDSRHFSYEYVTEEYVPRRELESHLEDLKRRLQRIESKIDERGTQ